MVCEIVKTGETHPTVDRSGYRLVFGIIFLFSFGFWFIGFSFDFLRFLFSRLSWYHILSSHFFLCVSFYIRRPLLSFVKHLS
jgi:hypothetical protein